MVRIQSESDAIDLLNDTAENVLDRENAVHYLQNHPSARSIERLIQALEDDAFGIRWAAAVALAEVGKQAVPPLLRQLRQRLGSYQLREGTYHVLHYNKDPRVREKAADLMRALKGPSSDIATATAASELLEKLS